MEMLDVYSQYVRFGETGGNTTGLTSRNFVKLAKDAKIVDKKISTTTLGVSCPFMTHTQRWGRYPCARGGPLDLDLLLSLASQPLPPSLPPSYLPIPKIWPSPRRRVR
mmetsp:Transcript_908/g.2379  ORF Transcript_908/g.2379 Transcript_908/m.2379 type:complete len:108 (-) Transcript_908:392-715(-)